MKAPIDCSRPDSIAAADPEVAERLTALADSWRDVFRDACAREKLRGDLSGPPHARRFSFEPQDTAPSELILERFLQELGARGVKCEGVLYVTPDVDAEGAALVGVALAATVQRVRTLLVEYNSWLSGGVPFPFATDESLLRDRGLAIYRYPARGAVDVTPIEGGMSIRFHAGDLGEVTSSGFYVPTRLTGDYRATIDYALTEWVPGPEQACLALFTQDEPSVHRYYAQRNSGGAHPGRHVVQASLCGETVGERDVSGERGSFRIERRGTTTSSYHKTDGEWTLLGTREDERAPDLIIGTKIWSTVSCGGLAARLTNLVIEASFPADQIPRLESRDDPRLSDRGAGS